MANFHCTVKLFSRAGGKSCVAALAYRTGTKLVDDATGILWNFTYKRNIAHVEVMLPANAPLALVQIAEECQVDRTSAFQKFSDLMEACEHRKDSQVYREVEFSLPRELTFEQNVEWAKTFVDEVLVQQGMVAVVSFHYDREGEVEEGNPHCHVLLSTRHLTEEGFGLKNRDWNGKDFLWDIRDQCCQYQNAALARHGHDVRVTHLSYADREIDIEGQPERGTNVGAMVAKGMSADRQKIFDAVRLKNQFKILKNPEVVFEIVTSHHATFTRKDVAKVLNRYIDNPGQFRILFDRLMASKELVTLRAKDQQQGKTEEKDKEDRSHKVHDSSSPVSKDQTQQQERREKEKENNREGKDPDSTPKTSSGQEATSSPEAIYTTRRLVKSELSLIQTAEKFATRKTHTVPEAITSAVIARYHKKFTPEGGLSADQERAIRHMLSGDQISCVVGYAGAGKTTCVEAAFEAWREAGYTVLGLAPTGKAQKSLEACGMRAMTVHRFLRSHQNGREKVTRRTIIVLDEAGMMDGCRASELVAVIDQAGAKVVPLGDNNQLQAVGPDAPFRLVTDRVPPVVLETIVRQKGDWQREASRLLGSGYPRKALKLYEEHGGFVEVEEAKPDLLDVSKTLDNYSLARQLSGRIWKEMDADVKAAAKREREAAGEPGKGQGEAQGQEKGGEPGKDQGQQANWANPDPHFEAITRHPDYATYMYWKGLRHYFVQRVIDGPDGYQEQLEARGVDRATFQTMVQLYRTATEGQGRDVALEKIEGTLRQMAYVHKADTRAQTRQALVAAWASDRQAFPKDSHLMLAFTVADAHKLNEAARAVMRQQRVIQGQDITYATQTIEEDDFGVESRVTQNRTFARGDRILLTRNDKGMRVSNGTLGTVVSLKPHKIEVLLDPEGPGNAQRTLSFAPTVYPFFDHGWATTVRKAQSVTVDHVKFLASWQDYRNLVYVALTRHRHSLKVFFSNQDFWRPEKVIDRLSRIQEKLAALDYLDRDKLHGQIREDTEILWHHWHIHKMEAKIQQGKDFLNAVKVTARDLFETWFPSEETRSDGTLSSGAPSGGAPFPDRETTRKDLAEEAYLSLEDSEEMRSQSFFRDFEEEDRELPGVSSSLREASWEEEKTESVSTSSSDSTPSSLTLDAIHRLKNQAKILRDPESVLKVVTSRHSTFTLRDIAKVLNDHLDDRNAFEVVYHRLAHSPELVNLGSAPGQPEPDASKAVFTTRTMLRIEQGLGDQAKTLSTRKTHPVAASVVDKVVARYNQEFKRHGGLSPDQQQAIRHMLSPDQISCVVGFAGAGKTTCLKAANQAWQEAGYTVMGIAPTGKAAQSLEACGIPSMTVHKFLKAHKEGAIPVGPQTVVVMDEAGMVDSRRFGDVFSVIEASGTKIVPTGDNYQVQSVEAGPAYRLVCQAAPPVHLETVVRQRTPWQRDASRLFGQGNPREALALYGQHEAFQTVPESLPDFTNPDRFIDSFCLARQVSGRIFKEILEDYKAVYGKEANFEEEGTFETLAEHQDFDLWATWRNRRHAAVESIIQTYADQKAKLESLGVDTQTLEDLVAVYQDAPSPEAQAPFFKDIETVLRKMSYGHIVDTRHDTKQVLVAAWAADWEAAPDRTHLMLAFTNRDTQALNETARRVMRDKGILVGPDYAVETKSIEEDAFKNRTIVSGTRWFAQGDRILFTLNNEALQVRNGTLGTILSINGESITVVLDAEGSQTKTDGETAPQTLSQTLAKTLTFSPRDYPFIDNGWATNIHKSQSVTAGETKLLGSYEQFRNLVYVGMTRHGHDLKVYLSDLDFWRPEKVGDRLARVQEKLSGFDYLEEGTIRDLLAEEQETPPSENRNTDDGNRQDLWGIFKSMAGRVTGKHGAQPKADVKSPNPEVDPSDPFGAVSSPQTPKVDFWDEKYLHLEDTEEKRSSDIFKDPRDTRGKGAFGGKTTEKTRGAKSGAEPREKGTERTETKGTTRKEERLAAKAPSSHHQPPSSAQSSPQKPPSSEEKAVSEAANARKDKPSHNYTTRTGIRERPLSYQEINEQLCDRVVGLAKKILGKPTRQAGNYLRFGRQGSISVITRGPKTGVFTNFETDGQGRRPLQFIQEHMGLSAKDARLWALDWLGQRDVVVQERVAPSKPSRQEQPEERWDPITPVPANAPPSNIEGRIQLRAKKKGSKCTGIHTYRDEEGRLIGYVVRFEKPLPTPGKDPLAPEPSAPEGKAPKGKTPKETVPFSYGEDEQGKRYWRWKGFFASKDNRTPYGVEKLKQDAGVSTDRPAGKPILVVEGEKTADAAQKLLPEYHVLSWLGGAGAVDKTSWSCLAGKTVVIWPDYDLDKGGQKAAEKLHTIVTHLNKTTGKEGHVGVVDLPDDLRNAPYSLKDGWDLADPLPPGWRLETVRKYLDDALGQTPEKAPEPLAQEQAAPDPERSPEPKTPVVVPKSAVSKSPGDIQREAFEASQRLPNQEWCATFGFMEKHRRFPETVAEVNEAYWQGERLTAIEGRLYQEIRDRGGRVHDEKLTLRARAELAKYQTIPESMLTFGKASDLTPAQLQHFAQHVLMHRDRTNGFPEAGELEAICQAIKVYDQEKHTQERQNHDSQSQTAPKEGRDVNSDASNPATASSSESSPKTLEENASSVSLYRRLIEQQAILARLKSGYDATSAPLKTSDVDASCAQKLKPLEEKIRLMMQLSQDMKDRDRQTQRVIDL